jgi:TPR repeat protein
MTGRKHFALRGGTFVLAAMLAQMLVLTACTSHQMAVSAYERGDKAEAERLFQIAASREGMREAQYRLAMMYRYGDGVPVEYTSAAYWFYAAYWRHPAAAYELAMIYEQGLMRGTKPDAEKAAEFYRHAADRSHKGAQAALLRLGIDG